MRFLTWLVPVVLLASTPASAAPLSDVARNVLAGGWRAGGCGAQAQDGAVSFTLEFAVTGGRMVVDTGDESGGPHRIKAIDATGPLMTFTLDSNDKWIFRRGTDGGLVSQTPPALFGETKGLVFRHCQPAADRSAIRLTARQIAAISGAATGGPVLIDLRAKKGCAALEYQYLNFDLVGPLGFELHRWNSTALGERLADGRKPDIAIDEISDFAIDKAEAVPAGYRFTVTELIPPNGSRGDTTTLTVLLSGKGGATIPEWKRSYALCTSAAP